MTEPRKPTAKPIKASKRAALQQWLAQHPGIQIGEPEYAEILSELAPISESYLRKLLRESGAPLSPVIAGVRQSDLDELESSLLMLLDEYERADSAKQSAIRKLVITAKDHARWATRRVSGASNKPEMILWMVTWLENPSVFRQWIQLRRDELRRSLSPPQDFH